MEPATVPVVICAVAAAAVIARMTSAAPIIRRYAVCQIVTSPPVHLRLSALTALNRRTSKYFQAPILHVCDRRTTVFLVPRRTVCTMYTGRWSSFLCIDRGVLPVDIAYQTICRRWIWPIFARGVAVVVDPQRDVDPTSTRTSSPGTSRAARQDRRAHLPGRRRPGGVRVHAAR